MLEQQATIMRLKIYNHDFGCTLNINRQNLNKYKSTIGSHQYSIEIVHDERNQ